MKLLIAISGLLAFAAGATAEPPATLDQLSWLEGRWHRQTRQGPATEEWTRVSAQTFEGLAWVEGEAGRRVTEHLRLEVIGEAIYYVALPVQNPEPTLFRLVEADEGRFVFENPEHDFPQRIAYMRDSDGGLHVRISGEMDGETRGVDFHFERGTSSAER